MKAPWYEAIQLVPTRRLYTLFIIVMVAAVLAPIRFRTPASRETLGAYQAVEQVPPGRLIMLQSTWDAGTIGECEGQWAAVVDHVMRLGKPFIVWTSNPASPPFYNAIIERTASRYGRTYGRDWVDFGYKVPGDQLRFGIQSMARDLPGFLKSDVRGTPVASIPLLKGVKDITAFDLVVTVGYNPIGEFIQFVQAVYGTRIVFGIAAINSTTTYSYMDSGQIVGMLVGARGGAEYETLVGRLGRGTEIIRAQSFCHVFIILAVIAANIGALAARRSARRPAE